MKKRLLFVGFLLTLFLTTVVIKVSLSRPKHPVCKDCNVVLIGIDTLRADHLSFYGGQNHTSPNLSELAKNATVFQNFFSNAPWTLPSFASMFTSNYPQNIKMQIYSDILDKKFTTLAQVLAENKYKTFAVNSKTHVSKAQGFGKGFETFTSLDFGSHRQDIDLIVPEATKWLENNKDNKFFMFLHTFQVHYPYCPPPEFDQFKDNYQGKINCVDYEMIRKNNSGLETLAPEDLERYKSLYDGDILFTDYYLGKLFESLKNLGLDKKTIIVVVSDHGEEFGERQYWGAHTWSLYNELLQVPLIIKAPNLKVGIENKPASIVDLAPTILDLVGIQKPAEFKGTSYRKLQNDNIIYSETSTPAFAPKTPETLHRTYKAKVRKQTIDIKKESIIQNGWKLILSHEGKEQKELYNLNDDPFEKDNLAQKNPLKEKEMSALMAKFKKENMGSKTSLWDNIYNIFGQLTARFKK